MNNRMLAPLCFMLCLSLSCTGLLRAASPDIEAVALVTLPKPPFEFYVDASLSRAKHALVRLQQTKQTKNDITDEDMWFVKNGLSQPADWAAASDAEAAAGADFLPPERYKGYGLVKAWKSDGYAFLIYGENAAEGRILFLYSLDRRRFEYGFDFENYVYSPQYVEADRMFIGQYVNWAVLQGNMLYVANGHNTYAKSSSGMNAYITALNIKTNKVLWRSQPLVANAQVFAVIDHSIISGYGFTKEPDYLYVLDKWTGTMADKIPLKSGPDYILLKGATLFVRTYDTDYEFKVLRANAP